MADHLRREEYSLLRMPHAFVCRNSANPHYPKGRRSSMKRLTVLTVLLLLALVVTACGPKATPTPAPAPTAAPQAAEPTKAPEPAKAAEPTMAPAAAAAAAARRHRWRERGRRGLQEPDLSGGCLQRQDEGHEGQHGRPVHRRRRREVRQLDQGLRGRNRHRHPVPGLEGIRGVDHDADAGRHGLRTSSTSRSPACWAPSSSRARLCRSPSWCRRPG